MSVDPALLAQAAAAAVACERVTQVPAELLLAQWAIESYWGANAPRNNCFGIKLYAGAAGGQLLPTREWFTDAELKEFLGRMLGRRATPTGNQIRPGTAILKEYEVYDWFACFPSLAACFAQRAKLFFTGRYKPYADRYVRDSQATDEATAANAFEKLLEGICPIYATDPNYLHLVAALSIQSNVRQAIAAATGQPAPAPASTSTAAPCASAGIEAPSVNQEQPS